MTRGLVLEGGAMRGMFTCGVLDVFMENGLEFDRAVGVSAGATFGCNFKSRQPGRAIRYNKTFAHDKRYCSFSSLIKTGDIFNVKFCYYDLPQKYDLFDYKAYRENPLEFYVVVSNCQTGLPEYHNLKNCDGDEIEWMRASASMPLVSRPVKIGEKFYLDGGMTDSIPLKFMESTGCEKSLVILTQPRDFVKKPNKARLLIKIALRKYPKLIAAMLNRHVMYNDETKYVFEREKSGSVFVICPQKSLEISRTERNPDELERVYQEGRAEGLRQIEAVRKFFES